MEVLLAIGGTIAGEIAKNLVAPIWRPFYYLIYYKHNIENLKEELQKLDDKRTEVGLRVNNAKSNLQVVVDSVIRWQEKADGIDRRSKEFIQNEMNVNKCLNRYSLSRKAKKMTENMLALLEEARNFGEIAYPDPRQKIELWFSGERIKNFKSRESILLDILMALKNDDLRVIGICGMSGIGKTTMVKQLMKNMETKKLFDEFAMVAVSDTPDFRKIQDEIASCLGLELKNDESEVVRASKLHQRLTNCDKRILLILDDVWKEDGLGEIGVPLGCRSNGCKIVLTSRNEFVCSSLGSQRNFLMKVLNDEEALVLFKETADDSIGHDLLDTVKEIINECEGLPIAIVTLSKALKNKNKHIWNDVLRHLKNSKLEDISGMKAKVFSAIELSYNYLEDEEAQSCFLLCSLFPEDFNILVEDLLEFGMGLRLFKGVEYVHEGRDRIYKLIDMLKGSNLLLEGDDIWNESVKMHDLVRDVAISLASRNKQWHTLQSQARINEWQGKDWYKNCTAISLLCEDIKKLKDHLKCPNLELLQLWHDFQNDCQLQSLPINVLEGMKGLKVLSIASRIPSLPQSIDVLKDLQTLCLWNDRLNEMHTIGDLVKLEILEVRSYRLEELPAEIGNLKNLRLLNLRRVENLRYIPPDVLVGLSKLEELYLPLRYMMKWEWKEDEEKTNASLSELGTHHITALHITVVNAYISPKASVFRNLIRFHIFVGKSKVHIVHKDSENVLHLKGDASDIKGSGICVLLRKVEVLYLEKVKNLKKIVNEIEDNSFADLKRDECVDALVRIPESPKSPLSCLSNLRKVEIYECDELKYFIPLSMARELRQFHSMTVMSCEKMEGIFYRNKVNDEIESPLTTLCLNNLPNFIGFIYKDIEESSASEINNRMEIVQSKTEPVEKICIFFSSLWLRLSKLQKLTLRNCGLVKALFHPSVTQQFVQLKELNISACCKMEYIVAEAKEEEKNKGISKIAFPNLTKLDLGDLPELVAFFADNDISFELYSLVCLEIWSCPKLKTHYCETQDSSIAQRFLRRGEPKDVSKKKDMEMEQPSTSQMKSGPMEMISTLFFPPSSPLLNLRELHIFGCDFQEAAFPLSVAQQLEQLKDLTISSCEKMEYIVAKDKGRSKIVLFPSLTDLDLSHLPNLMGFCKDYNVSLEWSLLERLWFYEIVPSKIVSVPKSSTLSTSDEVDHLDTTFCATLIPRKRKKQDNNFSKKVSLIKNQGDPSVSNTDESCAFPSKLIQQLQNLKHLRIHGSDSVEVIFSFEGLINGVLNSVEEICLVNLPNLKHLWFKIPPEITAFQNLRELKVQGCDHLINLFSICSAKLVGKLQSIKIRRCKRVEEIIGKEDEEISMQKIVFPQLRSLTLEDLPNLNSFCNRIYALEFPFLERLEFRKCKRMETFSYGSLSMPKLERVMIEGSDSVEVIFSFEGLINGVLNSVEEICLVNLPNLKHVWFKIPPEVTAFQNLRELIVIDCDNLINLFSICSAKLVGKLQSIEIRRCNRMEEIIGKEDEEISKQKIVFPQLRSLTLEDLPNFNSFCNRIYALELPFLETLKFLNWKRTETFFYGSLSMPKLEKVMINRRLHQLMGSDPNLNAKMSELLKMNQ